GKWSLGCSFPAGLTEDELQHFGAPAGRPSRPDERAGVRFPCQARVSYQRLQAPALGSHDGEVVNLSHRGLAMRALDPIHVGEVLSLDLRGRGEAPVQTILASVVRVTVEGASRLAGCSFIHELHNEQLADMIG